MFKSGMGVFFIIWVTWLSYAEDNTRTTGVNNGFDGKRVIRSILFMYYMVLSAALS